MDCLSVVCRGPRPSSDFNNVAPIQVLDDQKIFHPKYTIDFYYSTKPRLSQAPKTSLLTKKRNSKRVVLNEENKTVSKWKGQQNTRRGVKKHVDHVLPRNDSTATSTRSVSVTNSMVSPFVTNQRTIIAPKRQFIDGNSSSFSSFSTGQESRCSIGFRDESVGKDPETGECSEENHAACDPPVLSRINEAWREGRISAEASSSKHNTFELSTTQDEAFVKAANLDLTDECGRCLSACAQASQAADRLLEEINFIQDSKPMRRRRDKIPSWIREHYEASTATGRNSTGRCSTGRCSTGRSSSSRLSSSRSIKTMMKRSNSVVESKTKSTRIKRGMQDSPMDAVMPLGASYYMDNFTRRQRGFNQQTENLDHELKAFLNLRGQTPTNFSGTWMHQLQTLAERDLEAPLQAELRVCLARLAKLEFENRALKELVLLKCGLPKQIGIHKSNSSGASSVLSEDLGNITKPPP
eukprot:g4264.t1